jgi:hypothetical protein
VTYNNGLFSYHETISGGSPICTPKLKMRAKATLYHLQQVTHLQTHFANRALRTLKAGGLLSFPSSFYIFFFQLLLSSLSSPTGVETEQEWHPFTPAIPAAAAEAS